MDPEALLAWSQLDDNLLCSIVHEFGSNWRLVADIFAMSCSLSGIHRSATQCLKRFRELAVRLQHPSLAVKSTSTMLDMPCLLLRASILT